MQKTINQFPHQQREMNCARFKCSKQKWKTDGALQYEAVSNN